MKLKKIKTKISYLLCAMLLLTTGCGKENMEAPELQKPVAVNESYRPVEKGNVGDITIRDGVVVPTDYCHFYLTTAKVSEVKVEIGDYVEAGTVIVQADTEGASAQISSLSSQKSLNYKAWDIKCKIYEQNKKELEYKLKGAQENNDTDGAEAIKTQISVLDENHSYDQLFYNHQQSALDKEIVKQQEIAGDGTLVASHSGYVTYIKDLAESDTVNSCDNIVIISDYEDCYIELPGDEKGHKLEKIYPVFYTFKDGKRQMLKIYEYLPEELMTAQARTLTPPIRMKFAGEGTMPEVGSNVPVFLQKTETKESIIVGNDSLYEDEQGDFVYVKKGEGREIRYVTLGASDTFYTEVLSGLAEGEMVYYTSDSVLPETYDEHTVQYGDYQSTEESDFYSVKNTSTKKFYSEYEGQVETISVTQGQEVSVGELICTIRTNEGSATLTEMYNNIINFKASHVENVKNFDNEIKAKEDEIQAAYIARQQAIAGDDQTENKEDTEISTSTDATLEEATPTDAVPENGINSDASVPEAVIPDATPQDAQGNSEEEKVSPYLYEELNCQLEVIKLNKQLDEINYVHQLSNMEQQYNKVSCNNDGNGAINIYAEKSGKVTNLNLKIGKNIKVGDRLFNIDVPSSNVVELRSEDALQINQTIDFVYGDASYKGKVVGINGDDGSFYFTHNDNKVYISTNSGNQKARYFVKMEDDKFYDLDKDFVARYPKTIIKNSVVLPGHMVYQEDKVKSGEGTVTYTYVWKLVDGQLVKHYVQCKGGPAGSQHDICVISGLKEGDVIAQEFVDKEEE
ncbi:MAG: efflux RND transporter periplasmic adaptor subunit [Lachnospiraceae bacterium]|nr:efflux RND transporter periplasmic adaptor subunit [Lachnospiraceae bacterium]